MLLDPFFSTMPAGKGQECALVFLSVNFLNVTLPHVRMAGVSNFLGTSDSDVLVAPIVSVAAATTSVVLCDEVWVLLCNLLDVSVGLASDAKECDFPLSIKRALVSIEPSGGLNSLEIARDLKTWQTFCSESVDVLSISVTAVPKLRARFLESTRKLIAFSLSVTCVSNLNSSKYTVPDRDIHFLDTHLSFKILGDRHASAVEIPFAIVNGLDVTICRSTRRDLPDIEISFEAPLWILRKYVWGILVTLSNADHIQLLLTRLPALDVSPVYVPFAVATENPTHSSGTCV